MQRRPVYMHHRWSGYVATASLLTAVRADVRRWKVYAVQLGLIASLSAHHRWSGRAATASIRITVGADMQRRPLRAPQLVWATGIVAENAPARLMSN